MNTFICQMAAKQQIAMNVAVCIQDVHPDLHSFMQSTVATWLEIMIASIGGKLKKAARRFTATLICWLLTTPQSKTLLLTGGRTLQVTMYLVYTVNLLTSFIQHICSSFNFIFPESVIIEEEIRSVKNESVQFYN